MHSKEGQVTIFIILAVVIVGAIVAFFILKTDVTNTDVPSEVAPVFTYYDSCIERELQSGVELAGSQGGHITTEAYIPGSDYSPFSSQLTFLGFQIPYWYYVTGNNLLREQVPTKTSIQKELSTFIEDRLTRCDFAMLESEGFDISVGEAHVETTIEDTEVTVTVTSTITASKDGIRGVKNEHKVHLASKLGKFHTLALKLYDKEKKEAFLEKYSVDVLRLYTPVDGVFVQCSPHIWKTREVVANLTNALESNLGQIKFKGDYYTLSDKRNEYFVVDEPVDEQVRVIYSSQWPYSIEVTPAEQELMIAQPVGNEDSIGIAGFCYVPYHFVYDVRFPVLLQIYDENEVFQFPISVIIDNNVPRVAKFSEIEAIAENDLCAFRNIPITVATYDSRLEGVEARVSYQCFDTTCDLGSTKDEGGDSVLHTNVPACVNGYLITEAEGYTTKKQLFSSNSESRAEIILDRAYSTTVNLLVGGKPLTGTAIVTIDDGIKVQSLSLPELATAQIHEGLYNISVYAYGPSSITLPSSTKTQCQQVSRGGVLGFLGGTQEQCFEITVPETKVEYALVGGGSTEEYLLENDLARGQLVIDVPAFKVPASLEEVQYNFASLDSSKAEVRFS